MLFERMLVQMCYNLVMSFWSGSQPTGKKFAVECQQVMMYVRSASSQHAMNSRSSKSAEHVKICQSTLGLL